ncbi:MAG: ATP-binding cassette domain-containing protein [Eubacteriales bacterium]|nr:ATP-binding cassette domain-containing protein [Eubacteriales bacterium]
MIEFDHVSFSFPDKNVLEDISFRMEDGEFVGILGPNGGGKSTFLRLALGLLKPSKGKVIWKERKISYIAQTTSMADASFPATVEEIVSLGLVDSHLSFPSKEKKAKVKEMLERLNLTSLRGKNIQELSGGQQQRVKVAKALIGSPSLLVLDEPDAGMDEESHECLVTQINSLKDNGVGILFVSHHPEDLKKADHIYFIEDGKILTYEKEISRGHHHVEL